MITLLSIKISFETNKVLKNSNIANILRQFPLKYGILIWAMFICSITQLRAEGIYPKLSPIELKNNLTKLKQAKNTVVRAKLLISLGYHYMLKGGSAKSDTDSSLFFLQLGEKLGLDKHTSKEGISFYMLRSLHQLRNRNNEQFLVSMKIAVANAEKKEFHWLQGAGLFFLGQYSFKENAVYYRTAIECFIKAKNLKDEALVYRKLAEHYYQLEVKDRELINQLLLKSLETYKKARYTQLESLYIAISDLSAEMGNWPARLKYLLLAIETAKNTDNGDQLYRYYSNLGGIYWGLGQYTNALKYLNQSYEMSEKKIDRFYIYQNAYLIYDVYVQFKQAEKGIELFKACVRKYPPITNNEKRVVALFFTGLYCKNNRFDLAAPYYTEMLKMDKLINKDESPKGNVGYLASVYNTGIKDYPLATYYLKKAEGQIYKTDASMRLIAHQFFKLDSINGNLIGAIQHYQQYKKLNDSILTETKLKQMAELQIQYDIKKKEADLLLKDKNIAALNQNAQNLQQRAQVQHALLQQAILQSQKANLLAQKKESDLKLQRKNVSFLEQAAKLQHIKLEQADTTKKVLISGAILLMIIMFLLARQYRLKQKSSSVIAQKNQLLEGLISEKNWLIKEVHHRVKNNLQTVISLLESQSHYLKDDALKAMETCQHRIHVMSLIHQKLYQTDQVKTINMQLYIAEFVSYLADSFDVRQRIRFEQDLDAVELDISQAIPLALIVNEAVTNAIKYAFTPNDFGTIQVLLKQVENQIQLSIWDNGIGLKEKPANLPKETLGLKLMKGLSKNLDAKLKIDGSNGTLVQLSFHLKNDHYLSENISHQQA